MFLTPRAGLLALLALVPLLALGVGARRVDAARRVLRLPAPPPSGRRREGLLAAIAVLLALAAMQPVIRTHTTLRARTDAQVFVVLDTSRSMAASPSPNAPTRLAHAKQIADNVAARLGDIPVGVATFTDRVLPDLFPTSDHAAFDSTVKAVGIEDPPPAEVNTVATTFDALDALGTQGFFPSSVHKRGVVLVTDGESRPFDPAAVSHALVDHGITLVVVRVGSGADRVWAPNGKPEAGYRPDAHGASISVARLEAAVGNHGGQIGTLVSALGSGPTHAVGTTTRSRTLAPLPALLVLLPLCFLIGLPRFFARRTRSGYGLPAGTDRGRASS